MRTNTEKYLEKIIAQIEHNQEHMALVRKEVYPQEHKKLLTFKEQLSITPGTQLYNYREVKLEALKRMEIITNRLVVRLTVLQTKYNILS